ncbi:hypothetical protein AGDE_09154 [Angomonas deanei]|uniref:Uncharacterized protein n=1 Tax=Angomonas deanei TaxID=59799 RepID=A0A7G2C419_9TRYP|nr:hypothetical protein AGDE_09154 [Angomonas deanei]CAD2214538.1 hypothetical protein, conserved [Angomonas deanei]|eukprot:EPY31237.1 hypothetical protein AGDE_09154 [Angomonas deanei]
MQADLANPDTLTLTYVNTSHVFVEMDLDLLVREDDQLGRRLRHTGERPLYLGRVSSCPPALMGSNNDPNYNPNSGYNRNQNIEVNVNHPGETVGNGANVLYSPPADRVLYSPADDVMESSGQGPVPCIFPVRSHVVVDTPIVVSAATYYFTNNNNNSNNILQDRATVTALEAVMSGCERSTTVYPGAGPFAGSRLEVLPTQGVVTLNGQCVLRRVPAAHVRVTVDRHDASQWERYKGPFYLTPGRWCVRARASNHDDREVSSIARVFTVDVV